MLSLFIALDYVTLLVCAVVIMLSGYRFLEELLPIGYERNIPETRVCILLLSLVLGDGHVIVI